MEKRRQIAFAGVSVAMVMLTAACGSNDTSAGSANVQPVGGSSQTASAGVGASASAGAGAAAAGAGATGGYGSAAGSDAAGSGGSKTGAAQQLAVKTDAKLGKFVADSAGMTLYRFDEDTPKPAKSNCNDACATKWPPVPADDALAGAGIDSSKLGKVKRADGTEQLTLEGWPVYRYAGDTKAGDTKGQGVGGTWNALAPDGKPAGKKAAGGALQLMVSNNADLGKIMVDGKGMTVYRFDKDSAWPMKTACVDAACLDKWKPVKAVDTTKVAGVDASKVTSFKRPDGSKQAAFDCWLLYTFVGDKKPGDTNGQGVKGTWFAVTDKGKKAGQ
ncbi:SCO0930 family lipoprotein [Streptomyces sp. NBRC 110028]|uniref:SCO0930 family lipoprotein n=1 Tax=Streptomyces sp. NBRC 110028 TaxID=1621260 RepID=UPI0006E428A1|nr:SCO0930 family lipoprotein [Streptomyces sp. NBRC 110028]